MMNTIQIIPKNVVNTLGKGQRVYKYKRRKLAREYEEEKHANRYGSDDSINPGRKKPGMSVDSIGGRDAVLVDTNAWIQFYKYGLISSGKYDKTVVQIDENSVKINKKIVDFIRRCVREKLILMPSTISEELFGTMKKGRALGKTSNSTLEGLTKVKSAAIRLPDINTRNKLDMEYVNKVKSMYADIKKLSMDKLQEESMRSLYEATIRGRDRRTRAKTEYDSWEELLAARKNPSIPNSQKDVLILAYAYKCVRSRPRNGRVILISNDTDFTGFSDYIRHKLSINVWESGNR